MYLLERRKINTKINKILESIEVVRSEYIENEHFIDSIKSEIKQYMRYGFIEPDLKKSEILKLEFDDDVIIKWILYDYKEDYEPFIFLAAASNIDEYTDLLLDINKWKKELAEVKEDPSPKIQESTDSQYIIA